MIYGIITACRRRFYFCVSIRNAYDRGGIDAVLADPAMLRIAIQNERFTQKIGIRFDLLALPLFRSVKIIIARIVMRGQHIFKKGKLGFGIIIRSSILKTTTDEPDIICRIVTVPVLLKASRNILGDHDFICSFGISPGKQRITKRLKTFTLARERISLGKNLPGLLKKEPLITNHHNRRSTKVIDIGKIISEFCVNAVDAFLFQSVIALLITLLVFKCDIRIGVLHHISIGAHEKICLVIGKPRACKCEQGKRKGAEKDRQDLRDGLPLYRKAKRCFERKFCLHNPPFCAPFCPLFREGMMMGTGGVHAICMIAQNRQGVKRGNRNFFMKEGAGWKFPSEDFERQCARRSEKAAAGALKHMKLSRSEQKLIPLKLAQKRKERGHPQSS